MSAKLSIVCVLLLTLSAVQIATAQMYRRPSQKQPQRDDRYRESALRRFEIVSLSSLPFTAIESFFVVRGIEMIRQNQFSPELSDNHFMAVGIMAVSTSAFIGFLDWLRTHDKDPAQPRIPRRSKIPGLNLESYDESSLPGLETDGLTVALLSARF